MSVHYWPPVKPGAIAIGTLFTHASSLITAAPVFGALFQKAKTADSPKEFAKSQEAASALTVYGSSITGSAVQSYAVGALLNLTGTVTYKGASYLGGLIFLISQTPTVVNNILLEKRPVDLVIAKIVASLLETIGLSLTLTWWGTRTNSLTLP
ncbi:hypothetical protein DV495_000439 [Geotrichum candidum]|nr:hypothetical protein DV452_003936 [Geotrichum candidum]KAF5135857.1 hypothetical protein DV495_000439 [Geotrichum candidum]KAI8135877.1 hypothetical protein DUD61_000502 [Geotrichum candidum]KAI9210827.1 hypothetical protein DS838_004303 [Geotrichum bryndzae]